MYQSFSDLVDHIRSLNWTAEQLQFLAIVVAIPIALWLLWRLVTWPMRAKARRLQAKLTQETKDELGTMKRKLEEFEGRVSRLAIEDQKAGDALQLIVTGRAEELSANAEGPLVAEVDAALIRRLDTWLRERGLAVVDTQLARIVQERMRTLPDTVKGPMNEVVDGKALGLLSAWLDTTTQLGEITNATFANLAKDRLGDLPDVTKVPLYAKLDLKLQAAMEAWLNGGGSSDFNAAANDAFKQLMQERFGKLSDGTREKLNGKLDQHLAATVERYVDYEVSNGSNLNTRATELYRELLAVRRELTERTTASLSAKLDQCLQTKVEGYIDYEVRNGSQLNTRATELYRELVTAPRDLSKEASANLDAKLDATVVSRIGSWLDGGYDNQAISAHALAVLEAVLKERSGNIDTKPMAGLERKINNAVTVLIEQKISNSFHDPQLNAHATNVLDSILGLRMKQLPENVREQVQKLIDNAFMSMAQRMLEKLDDNDELAQNMRARLREIASGRSNW